ncbi:MAG: lytic transglycosylase domain-containing protein [Deltaproteobacteria bacterium]|nr:lytic transglycosylase domain-containing protein [Deltaproteobacteria bacterium]
MIVCASILIIVFFSPLYKGQNHSQFSAVTEAFFTFEIHKSLPKKKALIQKDDLSPICGKKAEYIFHPIIQKAADRYEIDAALVKAIIMVESSYNPNAVSKRGAKGLMQLMPRTAKALGVEDIFNPEHNINAGVRHFRKLLNRFDGDIKLALAAYNAGSKHVRYYEGIPPFKETRYYVEKVIEYYEYYKEAIASGINKA